MPIVCCGKHEQLLPQHCLTLAEVAGMVRYFLASCRRVGYLSDRVDPQNVSGGSLVGACARYVTSSPKLALPTLWLQMKRFHALAMFLLCLWNGNGPTKTYAAYTFVIQGFGFQILQLQSKICESNPKSRGPKSNLQQSNRISCSSKIAI